MKRSIHPAVFSLIAGAACFLFADALLFAQAGITPSLTEGPYYKTGSPERGTLYAPADAGRRIVITGRVLDSRGQPGKGAWIDVWQADAAGRYDNMGFAYREHLYADADGRYTLRTVLPGEYPGRTPHIHLKVRAPGGPILTT